MEAPVGPVVEAQLVSPAVPAIVQVALPDGVVAPVGPVTVAVKVTVPPTAGAVEFVGIETVGVDLLNTTDWVGEIAVPLTLTVTVAVPAVIEVMEAL